MDREETLTNSKDRQLMVMLVMDIIIFLLFDLAVAVYLMYQQVTQYDTKTDERRQTESLMRAIVIFSVYIPFCISCYVHLIASKSFRRSLKGVLRWRH